jgi:hypothetical protein
MQTPNSEEVNSKLIIGESTLIPESWSTLLFDLSQIAKEPLFSATASSPSLDHAIAVIATPKLYLLDCITVTMLF